MPFKGLRVVAAVYASRVGAVHERGAYERPPRCAPWKKPEKGGGWGGFLPVAVHTNVLKALN
jgi:hypothetical protein